MLRELHIENLAVIEKASIELGPGLNAFTGQTGAGKSLVIGAFELLLGIRTGGRDCASMVRAGAEEARVTGLFELTDNALRDELSGLLDRPIPAEDPLLITRRVFASGRSSVSVNGEPATAGMLKAVGQRLVDIHGQHDQQYLLRPSNQLLILDAFAGTQAIIQAFADTYSQRRDLQHRLESLRANQTERQRHRELMEFQAAEIDEAQLVPGEFEQLTQRYAVLKNIGALQSQAGQIAHALTDGDDTLAERVDTVSGLLDALTAFDPEHLTRVSGQLADACELIHDVGRTLSRYVDGLEADPDELESTEARLNELNRLIHKYAPQSHSDDATSRVLAFREGLAEQLDAITHDEADLAGIDAQIAERTATMVSLGKKLTKARTKAATALCPAVEAQLNDLGMAEARFAVDIHTTSVDDPNLSPTGLDTVEFVIQPNPGQAASPLRAIASGGELSRIMLALKSILAESDCVSVMVFDEIDANIGGRLGAVIGQKMHALANRVNGGSTHQVLCITHLPQIAAYADTHLHIAKTISEAHDGKQTHTTVAALVGEERQAELAEMIGGANYGQAAVAQAFELLAAAQKP